MRVLFLSQILPYPPDAGAKVRSYHTLRHLSQHHELTLLSFVRQSDPGWAVDHLRSFCRDVRTVPMRRSRLKDLWLLFRSLAAEEPFLIARDRLPSMAAAVRKVVLENGPFDVIHADQLWMAEYAQLASATRPGPRTILDQHNAVFQIPQRMAATEANPLKRSVLTLESRKLAAYESRLCRRFDQVVWVTEEDREALRTCEFAGKPEGLGTVIPIGIEPPTREATGHLPNSQRVTFLGGFHWPPNADGVGWFLRYVWPLVKKAIPEALFTIGGAKPPAELRSYQSDSVKLSGYVDDVSAYLADAAVFVVPLMAAGGMRVKILDAWARGVPVVSTRIGAEGLRTADGENLLLADTAESFADAVVKVLTDPIMAAALARNGRRTVEEYYDWRRIYGAWDEVYSCTFSSSFLTLRA